MFEDEDFRVKVTREEFEGLCQDLIDRVGKVVRDALTTAQISMVMVYFNVLLLKIQLHFVLSTSLQFVVVHYIIWKLFSIVIVHYIIWKLFSKHKRKTIQTNWTASISSIDFYLIEGRKMAI